MDMLTLFACYKSQYIYIKSSLSGLQCLNSGDTILNRDRMEVGPS